MEYFLEYTETKKPRIDLNIATQQQEDKAFPTQKRFSV